MTIYKLTDFTGNMFSVNKPNLLLNSDFRDPINPRGQTTYTGGKAIACWKLATNSDTFTINDGYITVTGSGIRQYLDIAISDTFILSVKYKEESDMIHFIFENFDGTYVEKVISGHKCGIEFSTSTNKMIVYFWNNGSSENYEYAKLSEGNIITFCEKEDKAIAQMRSESYLRIIPNIIIPAYEELDGHTYFSGISFERMAGTPSVSMTPIGSTSIPNLKAHDVTPASIGFFSCSGSKVGIQVKIELSCEP